MEDGGGISGGSGVVFHIISAARLHASGGNQGETTGDSGGERVCDKVVARGIGQGVVTSALITDGRGDEGIALLGIGNGA